MLVLAVIGCLTVGFISGVTTCAYLMSRTMTRARKDLEATTRSIDAILEHQMIVNAQQELAQVQLLHQLHTGIAPTQH